MEAAHVSVVVLRAPVRKVQDCTLGRCSVAIHSHLFSPNVVFLANQ